MIKKILASLCLGVALLTSTMAALPVLAVDDICADPAIDDELKKAAGCNLGENDTAIGFANNIIQVVLGLMGVLAVIVIIIGGILYIISTGDAGKVNRAKHTIMYGIIGLIVSLLAYSIVTFVIKSI